MALADVCGEGESFLTIIYCILPHKS
jgi:hypothetical protein